MLRQRKGTCIITVTADNLLRHVLIVPPLHLLNTEFCLFLQAVVVFPAEVSELKKLLNSSELYLIK